MHFPQFLKLAAGYPPGSKYEVGNALFCHSWLAWDDFSSRIYNLSRKNFFNREIIQGQKVGFCDFSWILLLGMYPGENVRWEKISFVIRCLPGVGSHQEFTNWVGNTFSNASELRANYWFLSTFLRFFHSGQNLSWEEISFVKGGLPGLVSHEEFTIWAGKCFRNTLQLVLIIGQFAGHRSRQLFLVKFLVFVVKICQFKIARYCTIIWGSQQIGLNFRC